MCAAVLKVFNLLFIIVSQFLDTPCRIIKSFVVGVEGWLQSKSKSIFLLTFLEMFHIESKFQTKVF